MSPKGYLHQIITLYIENEEHDFKIDRSKLLMKLLSIVIFILSCISTSELASQDLFIGNSGLAEFTSDAPLELIQGQLSNMQGALNLSTNSFAFKVQVADFKGFNNPLQQIHFRENFLETKTYPEATFSGKIIEDIDLSEAGEYEVRAKGKFIIHGIAQERIIKGKIVNKENKFFIECDFEVPLKDHDIRIPRIVYQKIAEIISVSIKIDLKPA